MANVIRLKPFTYIHVLDNNTNVTRIEIGPQTFTRPEHETVIEGPSKMVLLPPRHYCTISNPVIKKEDGGIDSDVHGNYKLRHGDMEIRFEQEPFPLYPGEVLSGPISPLTVVQPNSALRLKALRDYEQEGIKRNAGDEWLFPGPATYLPHVAVSVVQTVRASIIKQNEALRLKAVREFTDANGTKRKAGEEWLVRKVGAYMPDVDEEIVATVRAIVLTEKKALHLRATNTYIDVYGKKRRAGEEWLVTLQDTDTHLPDVYETIVGDVHMTTLTNRQYCIVLDPKDKDGHSQFGQRELRKGEANFFLYPGERLERGIQNVHVLGEEEALLLRAKEAFKDAETGEEHQPGHRWMIHGPCDYVPPVEVEIVEGRKTIALDENEGIYVRDLKTGKVKVVKGQSYLLQPHEELWEKKLPADVLALLDKTGRTTGQTATRKLDTTRVVKFRAPHGSAVQVYDYIAKKSRVAFGPELVLLGPDEHFTVLSLSGCRPKRPNQIQSLCLFLGPDFMTDLVTVETSDHARLNIQLAYNWHFDVKPDSDEASQMKIFSVPDFVGDSCKAIASRVRGAVAAASFDSFHKDSALIIKKAVFGSGDELRFPSNNLVITNVDIQSVEPVDQRTRDSLQKSVQLAIEITTKSQEAEARHEAERLEQEARGRLERQKISDEAEAEEARKRLLELQAKSAAVESAGQAIADARARAEAAQIEGNAAVQQSQLKAEAVTIQSESALALTKSRQEAEIEYKRHLIELEVSKARQLAEIEARKFKQTIDAIGADTIASIAQAGPELQAKLLNGLGLQSTLIVDSSSPVNLFSTAQGLLGGVGAGGPKGAMPDL